MARGQVPADGEDDSVKSLFLLLPIAVPATEREFFIDNLLVR